MEYKEKCTCSNCDYWVKMYQQCEHPEQRQSECGAYEAPPEKTCDLWEAAVN